jgi:Holliday junction resolvase RusA-like endonuclease
MNYYIIVFKNTLDAMTGEKVLKDESFKFKIMPTPTAITQSCGICIRSEVREDIDNIIKNKIIAYKNIYEKLNGEYVKII